MLNVIKSPFSNPLCLQIQNNTVYPFEEFWAGLDSHPWKAWILLKVGNKLYKDKMTVYLTSGYLLQYHPASEISSGSFMEGNYTFPLGFLNFSSILFVDNYTGYVGIGSPASSYLLEVSGNFSAEEIYQGGNRILNVVVAGIGIDVNGESPSLTVSHADTSSQASVDNSDGTVIQDISLDEFGHVTSLSSVDLDNRYILEGGQSSSLTLNGGACVLDLKAGSQDHAYPSFYPDSDNPEARRGWIGYGNPGDNNLTVANEINGGYLILKTGNTARMVIDGEGRIGINTLSPGRTVDVAGELEADAIYQNGNQVLDVGKSFSGDVSGSYNNLQLGDGVVGSDEIANGTVDWGDISVNAIRSEHVLNGSLKAGDVDSSEIQLRVAGSCPEGQSIRVIYENGTVVCETDDGLISESDTLSDVLSRGNVAENYVWLNASEGSLKLGPGSQNHSYIEFYQEIGGEQRVGWIGYGGAGTTDLSIVNEMSGGDILFYVHGTSAMKIDNSGNVAIGSSPQSDSRLVVQGDIRLDGASPTYRIKNVDTQSILMSPAYGDLLMNILIPVHCSQMELSCAEAIDYYSQRGDGTTANRNTPVFVKYLPQIYRWYDGGDMLIEYGEMNSIGGVWLCPNLLYPQCT